MSAKKTKKMDKHDRAVMAAKNEQIINDLLLQFAYTLTVSVLSIFVFNATANYRYGYGAYVTTRGFMWALFALSLILGIGFAFLYKNKGKGKYKTVSIYSFITAGVAFWYVGLEKVLFALKFGWFTGTQQILKPVFPLLGLALLAEFVVYFVRYYSLNGKKR